MEKAWIRIRGGEEATGILTTALERGFETFVLDVPDKEAAALRKLGRFRALRLDGDRVLDMDAGAEVARRVVISSIADQDVALALAGRAPAVLIDARDWKIIPIENLIAAYARAGTLLVAEVVDVEEARVFLETLERGVDTVVLTPDSAGDVLALTRILEGRGGARVDLTKAKVTRVLNVGSGDRVCVDTASLLRIGEGLLVGSQSGALVLVHSESLESGYVAARPFRVNAGPVHAYCLLPDGRTKYLSELAAGDEVLAVDAEGRARSVVVGRVKIETRPLLLVEAQAGDARVVTLLQNAETIRLVTPEGPVSVVNLAPGDEILVRIGERGRHFGTVVDETIVER